MMCDFCRVVWPRNGRCVVEMRYTSVEVCSLLRARNYVICNARDRVLDARCHVVYCGVACEKYQSSFLLHIIYFLSFLLNLAYFEGLWFVFFYVFLFFQFPTLFHISIIVSNSYHIRDASTVRFFLDCCT